MSIISGLFQPAPYQAEIQDQDEIKQKYRYWRLRVFYSMFLGYVIYYFSRKSFTFAMPALMVDLSMTKEQLGILASIWSITYGVSKFVSGVIGDRSNARYFMSFGLLMTGLCNIFFGCTSSPWLFALFWGLNGWFQGFGWPACARLLTHWYSQTERGRWWSFWNTSHNVGGAIIPIVTALFAQYFGWRYAMIFPGAICVLMALVLFNRLTDTPQSLGLPTIEKFRDDYPSEKAKTESERELSIREILFEHVLTNRLLWILAVGYYFVYMIRTAVNDWSVLYLVEAKGYTPIGAGGIIAWFEAGGFFGNLVAGWASDRLFQARRGPIISLFSLGVAAAIGLFLFGSSAPEASPFFTNAVFDSVMLAMFGFFIFGPQMLIGMAAAELSHKKAAATASGFTGCVAYLGAATAGYPLGAVIQNFGWSGFFVTLMLAGVFSTLIILPLWSLRSRESKPAEKKPPTLIEEAKILADKESRLELEQGFETAT